MSDSTVTTTFFADEKQAIAALTRLEKKYADLENALKHVHSTNKQHHSEAMHHLAEWGSSVAGMALGFASVEGGIERMFEAMKEFHKEADAAALSLDKSQRAFAIQTGSFGPQGKKDLHAVHEGGIRRRCNFSHGDAESLYHRRPGKRRKEKGFDSEAILKNFSDIASRFATIKTASGGNLDTQVFADAITKGLARDGKKDAAALMSGSRGLYGMTAGTEATAADVSQMGETLASLKGGKGEQRHAMGLARLGLKFGDVDMIGEDQATALGRMAGGLKNVKAEDRMGVMKNIVGDPELARKMLSALEKMAANDKHFDQAVKVQTSGLAAGKQRTANETSPTK